MIGRIALWLGILLFPLALCGADTCTSCHASLGQRDGWEHSFSDWQESLHAQVEVDCVSCHGGDGSSATVAMSKWHAFDLDAVEEALSRGRPLLHAADGGP